MMNYWYGHGPYGGAMGGVVMVFWWVLVIVAIVALVRWLREGTLSSGGHRSGHDKAMVLLRERYAKGEIDKKEFEERKKDLE